LAFFQQNALVRCENLAAYQVKQLSALGPQTYRGTVADEPLVSQGNDRVTLPLRDVVWLGPTTGTVTAKVTKAALKRMGRGGIVARQDLPAPPQLLAGNVQLSFSGEAAVALIKQLPFQGQRIECAMMLSEPPPPAHTGLFDYQAYLREHGVSALGSIWAARSLRLVADEDMPWERVFYSHIMPLRRTTLQFLKTLGPTDKTGLMQAILLGDMGGITPRQRDAYARSGVAHLLAVSGTHTALIAVVIFMFCRLFQISPRVSAVIVVALLALYAILTGLLPPVTRSAAMVFFCALPLLTRRTVDSLTAFSLAAAVTLLIDPTAYLKPDFQLSYLCVFGMIILKPALSEVTHPPLKIDPPNPARGQHLVARYFLEP
ncbi:TPA: hypothetical protein DDW35_09200, partial [Candidatus Sumerlaeota bacterium]|nr:hypothetical protein [Candidatus Sumerlaeota bacterium]